jgi:mannan endo-1,4-beta-mannosidase
MAKYLIPLLLLFHCIMSNAQPAFIQTKNHQFTLDGKPYYYAGTNYWYGSLLALQPDSSRGIDRLRKELDFLQSKGIQNLRVLGGVEGSGIIQGVPRVQPPFQTGRGKFDKDVLYGLDVLLSEMGKRHMKAVVMLSNNWEWSGGFLQYLNWRNQLSDSLLQTKLSWDSLRDVQSTFYSCEKCIKDYRKQVAAIVEHTNSITGVKYIDNTTIMSWELANEPRPMRPTAIPAYLKWVTETARFIKSKDKHHLVTTGSEGWIGSESAAVYEQAHTVEHIDYLTIHIWPKNWGWFRPDSMQAQLPQVVAKTNAYILQHDSIAQRLKKPLVIEEFGLPRDGQAFHPSSITGLRDEYYRNVFSFWQRSVLQNGAISGINFWAFGGTARPYSNQVFWKEGDDYMGDPPMEEQGLNTVFDTDESTWKVIGEAILAASRGK